MQQGRWRRLDGWHGPNTKFMFPVSQHGRNRPSILVLRGRVVSHVLHMLHRGRVLSCALHTPQVALQCDMKILDVNKKWKCIPDDRWYPSCSQTSWSSCGIWSDGTAWNGRASPSVESIRVMLEWIAMECMRERNTNILSCWDVTTKLTNYDVICGLTLKCHVERHG